MLCQTAHPKMAGGFNRHAKRTYVVSGGAEEEAPGVLQALQEEDRGDQGG